MPTTSRKITSRFGYRWNRQHKGIDIKVYIGDTIRSAFEGKARIVKYDPKGYGYYIVIRHPNGLETIYGHLSKQLVTENQIIECGQPIGLGGNTGRSTGSHLHFETRLCGLALNPELLFDFPNQDVTDDFYVFNNESNSNDPPAKEQFHYHKVKLGETIEIIARQTNVEVEELCKINNISKNATLRKGMILKYRN